MTPSVVELKYVAYRSVRRGGAGHRETGATLSESLGRAPFRSRWRPVGGRRMFLGFKDAQHLNFSGHDLASVEMVAGQFAQACFVGTSLARGDLFGANVERADMQNADLTRADLRGANLRGTTIELADTRGAIGLRL